ncbi:uracil-DNA glycosylase family protein [Halomarina ordinaria]|uniref:Uracil-DNA glycosylase family protein n=1 Tax=Halomarina ordinaria TaxID=3033939 RepID=A0ABD5U4K6_9EURY|nr:uracil-DNA glycosylase family protein [Halomarina sp. PSRA2]
MKNVTDRTTNPFGMRPPCERYVAGYGDANADFHVVGDHPGVHGGVTSGVPFTNEAGRRLLRALADADLLESAGEGPVVNRTFLSYLHMCVVEGTPTEAEYVEMERFFDAELRAIAAHVLLPVGERAIRHVLGQYTARRVTPDLDAATLHATEIRGSGFLVYPIRDPSEWGEGDEETLVESLQRLQAGDFYREVDLGRFMPGDEPYRVR